MHERGMFEWIEHDEIGRTVTRIALAFEAGRDGFWLACGAWRRGSRDPSLECRGIAGASPRENRPARHRAASTAQNLGMGVRRAQDRGVQSPRRHRQVGGITARPVRSAKSSNRFSD
jgi:hypothetical protein